MKKISILLSLAMLLAACDSSNDKKNINPAQDVCDCYKKANEINPSDEKRTKAQDACIKMEYDLRDKLKRDKKRLTNLTAYLANVQHKC